MSLRRIIAISQVVEVVVVAVEKVVAAVAQVAAKAGIPSDLVEGPVGHPERRVQTGILMIMGLPVAVVDE
jgi:hypothetical protein